MPRIHLTILSLFLFSTVLLAQPRPTQAQLDWHQQEYYWFMHFGPNTFTGAEWGTGKERSTVFSPAQLDTRQWCRLAKAAGATGIIITAKHHDGFCLWPSKYSTHTVRESGWRGGKGDVLKELSTSCREYGLKFGVYLSPWDRNHPDYGTPRYNEVFAGMLTEIFTNYGPIWELWWDGANGEGPNGKKQVYDWELFRKTVRALSPNTVVFSDVGPDIRWVGNEKGFAGETNWNTLDIDGFTAGEGGPPTDTLTQGNKYGAHWIPAECDVSIRPGWFWRRSEDSLVKSPETLFDLYLKSVGRGANLLLNVPPNDKGLVSPADSISLMKFYQLWKRRFSHDLIRNAASVSITGAASGSDSITIRTTLNPDPTNQSDKTATSLTATPGSELRIQFRRITTMDAIQLEEDLRNGQSCARFELELFGDKGESLRMISGTTIGRKRILTFPVSLVKQIRLKILEAKGPVIIQGVSAFNLKDGRW